MRDFFFLFFIFFRLRFKKAKELFLERELNEIEILSESEFTLKVFQVDKMEFIEECENGCSHVMGIEVYYSG